jgi:polyribonucleotide nucleotidyltransferase
VKLIDIDEKNGNLKLSRKVLIPRPERSGDQKSGDQRHSGNHRPRPKDKRPQYRENKPQ